MKEETRQFLKVVSLLTDEQMDELQENLKVLSCGGTKKVKQDVQFDMALQMLVSNFVKSNSVEVQ
tara:strand:+ start:5114 stop:5308 length:195 start_codon:yes stop_codon:yes gene_type:complete